MIVHHPIERIYIGQIGILNSIDPRIPDHLESSLFYLRIFHFLAQSFIYALGRRLSGRPTCAQPTFYPKRKYQKLTVFRRSLGRSA
jgi:hypothetical protein